MRTSNGGPRAGPHEYWRQPRPPMQSFAAHMERLESTGARDGRLTARRFAGPPILVVSADRPTGRMPSDVAEPARAGSLET